METVKTSAKFKEEELDKGVARSYKELLLWSSLESVLCHWEGPCAQGTGGSVFSLAKPSQPSFADSFTEPPEYAAALTRPFFMYQLPNENLVSELPFYILN